MDRLTITEAADQLGISEDNMQDRLERNEYGHEKDPDDGKLMSISIHLLSPVL
jgi:hypothetical protein